MKVMKLFLDDERNPIDVINYIDNDIYKREWYIVRTYDEFIKFILYNGVPDIISFDHDIACFSDDREYTGYDCAKWLVDFCIDNSIIFPSYLIHSGNTVGRENIDAYIKSYYRSMWI